MEDEIGDQTFSIPSLELARILSPRTPKPGVEPSKDLLSLDQYNCTVDGQPFQHALDKVASKLNTESYTYTPPTGEGTTESSSYPPLAEFLTGCVNTCHDALDEQGGFPPRTERWYRDLEFTVGRQVGDRVGGAAPLKPDITGGKGITPFAGEQLFWNPPPRKPAHGITLPVEVKKQWRPMVAQAATYARCLFSVNPRTFALVLAFNQESNALRFLLFHHCGLTGSMEYNVTEADGLKEIARLFLTLALWRTAEEAGFITYYNDTTYLLPGDRDGTRHVLATVERRLFSSLSTRGRMTSVSRLRLQDPLLAAAAKSPASNVPKPLVESGGSLRRSARLLEKQSTASAPVPDGLAQRPSRGSRGRKPTKRVLIPKEKGKAGTEEQTPRPARSRPTTRSASKKTSALPAVQEQIGGRFFSGRLFGGRANVQ